MLLLLPVVSADFSASVVTIKEIIVPGESAIFDIQISNLGTTPARYTLSSEEFSYLLFIDSRPGEVAPGEIGTFRIEVNPRNFVNLGTHRVPITIRNTVTGVTSRINPIIFIRDPQTTLGEYVPSIALEATHPTSIDPREPIPVQVHLRNRNARSFTQEELSVRISSELFYDSYHTSLGPVGDSGEKATERLIRINPYQEPTQVQVTIEVLVQNRTVSSQQGFIEITSFSVVEQDSISGTTFFKEEKTYIIRNNGNINTTHRIELPVSRMKQLFFATNTPFTIEFINDQRTLVFSTELQPLEEQIIQLSFNYRLLVLLVLLGAGSIVGYFLLRSPLLLAKKAELSDSSDDASEIKVRLYIKNRSAQAIKNLRVIDRMNGLCEVVERNDLGTIKPTKVVHKKNQGTLLRWDLDVLEAFEERIITYSVRTPLALVGDIVLPNMKVKFDGNNGRERTTHSNEHVIKRLD